MYQNQLLLTSKFKLNLLDPVYLVNITERSVKLLLFAFYNNEAVQIAIL